MTERTPACRLGESVGPFRIEALLGEGAMGVVYRAVDDQGVAVALKLLREELAGNESYRRRFAHEARAARDVSHPALVPILEAGEADGRAYLAFAFVEGVTLSRRIEAGEPLSLQYTVRTVSRLASALDAIHAKGLIHRDVKPSNIMLDGEGSPLLTDFGLAKGPAYTVLTRPGEVMGTLDYLAPELIRGEPASPASDLYALGCVAFECLAGQPPFGAKHMLRVAAAHLEEDPPDLAGLRPEVAPELAWAVTRALAKEPSERPPTGRTYAQLLRAALS